MFSKASRFLQNAIKDPQNALSSLRGKYKQLKMNWRKSSVIFSEDDLFTASNLPTQLIDKTIDVFQPLSVLDLGAGTGRAVAYFVSKGIPEVLGVEGSSSAISKSSASSHLIQFDLNHELNLKRKFDLIFSYEFVEHIHPKYVDNLLKTFSNHSDKIVLSAAKPGQGGLGHFNEQLPEYWISQFVRYGYSYDSEKTFLLKLEEKTYPDNILVFIIHS